MTANVQSLLVLMEAKSHPLGRSRVPRTTVPGPTPALLQAACVYDRLFSQGAELASEAEKYLWSSAPRCSLRLAAVALRAAAFRGPAVLLCVAAPGASLPDDAPPVLCCNYILGQTRGRCDRSTALATRQTLLLSRHLHLARPFGKTRHSRRVKTKSKRRYLR